YFLVAVLFYLFSRRWVSFKTNFLYRPDFCRLLSLSKVNRGDLYCKNGKKRVLDLAREAFPFGAALFFSLLISKIDTLLLSIMPQAGISQAEAVGHYNLGFKLFEFVLAVPVFFMNVVYPLLVKNLATSKEFFVATIKKSFLILFNMAVWGSVVLYITAPYLIKIFAKDIDIGPAVQVLRNMTLFTPVFFITALLMWVLVVFKKQKALIGIYVSAFVFSLTLNYLFIPHYSYLAPSVIKGFTEILILIQLTVVSLRCWRTRLTDLTDCDNICL
ncbi:hypothetical protein KKB83_02075, partial [Patescibacteria group bacterium]|nr:hypothetical protein [Patescibacteria group bacterium]